MTVESIEGKRVIVVEVPELDFKNKPLFFKTEGLPRGAWRRIGSTDQRCTEEDLHVFYTEADNFDTAIAEDTDLEDLDENAVRIYRELRAKVDPDAEELKLPDIEMLRSLKAVKKTKDGRYLVNRCRYGERCPLSELTISVLPARNGLRTHTIVFSRLICEARCC